MINMAYPLSGATRGIRLDMLMRIAHVTDVHADCLAPGELEAFAAGLIGYDAVIVTGDIAQADSLADSLETLRMGGVPLYYVLGNHDFWGSSMEAVRESLASDEGYLHGLEAPVWLGPHSVLLGVDGWYDCYAGRGLQGRVIMNDWYRIAEFQGARMGGEGPLVTSRSLGCDAARMAAARLEALPEGVSRVVFATHVPPFRESARYSGRPSGDDYAPFFVAERMGDVLLQYAAEHPDTTITVLCGHSHEAYEYKPLPNLSVCTGRGDYGSVFISGEYEV